ncbi:MAG: hypothetical protein LAT57_02195 [Balneolales bacterium]|nr:hypothetical protein [Balneolales bacterium]
MSSKINVLLIFIVGILSANSIYAQQHPGSLELGPFYYGMHVQDALSSGYNVIHQEQLQDGTHLLALMLNGQERTIAVIQFPPYRMPYAYSLQISGYDRNQQLFGDITLGMSRSDLYERLGIPSDSTFIEDRDVMLYFYDSGNYSFEIKEDTGLYSFAVRGDETVLRHFGFSENWFNYSLMHIHQVVTMYAPEDDNLPMIMFNATSFRPRVVFTGNSRPAKEKSRDILDIWGESRNLEPDVLASFQIEIEVTFGMNSYWVLMDERMLPDLVAETENGAIPVDLFAMLIGFNEAGPVLICNEFVVF